MFYFHLPVYLMLNNLRLHGVPSSGLFFPLIYFLPIFISGCSIPLSLCPPIRPLSSSHTLWEFGTLSHCPLCLLFPIFVLWMFYPPASLLPSVYFLLISVSWVFHASASLPPSVYFFPISISWVFHLPVSVPPLCLLSPHPYLMGVPFPCLSALSVYFLLISIS
jgi:hypothetical protein